MGKSLLPHYFLYDRCLQQEKNIRISMCPNIWPIIKYKIENNEKIMGI